MTARLKRERPASRTNAGNRANQARFAADQATRKPNQTLDLSVVYVSKRYRFPVRLVALVSWLADLGRALS